MAGERAFLDFNASAPLLPAAREAALAALDSCANPSSVHTAGRAARRTVEEARAAIAALVNAEPGHVVFTSGATEAATTLLTPNWRLGRAPLRLSHLYVLASDHPCLLCGGRFDAAHVTTIGVDSTGLADLAALSRALELHDAETGLPLVAIHAANNETGVIQPVAEIAELTAEAGGVLVVDAVQAAGRIAIDLAAGHGDFVILSGHKIGAPAGVGAFVARSELMMPEPLVRGGGQERGHRAGTENVSGIAGFGAAARVAAEGLDAIDAVAALRDRFETGLRAIEPDVIIHGEGAPRLANTSYFALPGIKAETVQIAFDLAGIAVSAGSACSSGKVGSSHVLEAMGADAQAGAVRLSIGHATTTEEISRALAAVEQIVARRDARSAA